MTVEHSEEIIEALFWALGGLPFTPEEQVEWDFLNAEWEWAKLVRETSNTAEDAGIPVDEIVWT